MKKMKCRLALATAGLILSQSLVVGAVDVKPTITMEEAQQVFVENVDVDYSYNLAVKLSEIKDNEALGYRTAGSNGEILTGEMLTQEMKNIGLTNVTRDEISLDTWTFEKAQLTYNFEGTDKTVELGSYQTNLNTNGQKEFQVIYAGSGTEAELEGLDVEGKFVLVDINQRENWWISYPAYEAYLNGAAGVIAAQDGGYSEISEYALNAQDICGPEYAVALSISRAHADELISTMVDNEVTVTLDAKSVVEANGSTFNVWGVIEGKNPEKMVLMSAHYDSYFDGFQDDNAAIALMMGIAKGLVDSGYQPENTLVFCALASEEWGAINTRYDWSTGAYNQIFNARPEWQGKVVANINFELPAIDEGTTDHIRSSYELKTFNEDFATTVPAVDGVFEDGIEVIVPTHTWSDDFSLSIAGIPANVTSLKDGFAKTHYHSQFDNKDTYNELAFLFHHNMYGMLMIAYDQTAISPLDFSTRFESLLDSVDVSIFDSSMVDTTTLRLTASKASKTAETAYAKVLEENTAYLTALNSGDDKLADEIVARNEERNTQVLSAFRYAQDNLVKLTWEDLSIFPHEHSQNNIAAIDGAIEALEAGDAFLALDEYLYLVDNNWYAYDWSRTTFDYFTSYVKDQPAERLFWGAGRVQGHEDLYDVIKSLQSKLDVEGADFTEEITALNAARTNQITMLKAQVKHEVDTLNNLITKLEKISK